MDPTIRLVEVVGIHDAGDLADPTVNVIVGVFESFDGGQTWSTYKIGGTNWFGGQLDRHGVLVPMRFGFSVPNDGQSRHVRAELSTSKRMRLGFNIEISDVAPQ
jgi:hypothetical protein